jgi:uncharacterized protein YbaP (TraB family)
MNPAWIAKIELWALRGAAVLALFALTYIKGCDDERHRNQAREALRANALAVVNAQNRADSTIRQTAVDLAEAAQRKAEMDLANYRRTHPISSAVALSMCPETDSDTARACQGAGDVKAVAACQASRVLQRKVEIDNKWRRIDDLVAEAEEENANYATCLATRPLATTAKDNKEDHR